MCKNNSTHLSAWKNYMDYQNAVTFQDCSKLILVFDLLPSPPPLFLVFSSEHPLFGMMSLKVL